MFAPVIQPSEVIKNNVNVDVQPTPIENNFEPDITIQPADVTVQEAPKGKRKVRVKIDRDKNGFISSASGTVEDGQKKHYAPRQ